MSRARLYSTEPTQVYDQSTRGSSPEYIVNDRQRKLVVTHDMMLAGYDCRGWRGLDVE